MVCPAVEGLWHSSQAGHSAGSSPMAGLPDHVATGPKGLIRLRKHL